MSLERIDGQYASYMVAPDVLSKGGVGSIHRTSDQRWVFKRYLRPEKAPDLRHLRQLVDIGREVLVNQGAAPGQTPESSVNWPVDVALDRNGAVTGVVLPAIPAALFNEFGKPRGLEFLIMARARPPSAEGRIALLLRMAEILAFVDERGLVHGDVNGKNLVWTVSPAPVMYLIDCDGMVPQHPPPTVGVQAMGWTDPRVLDGKAPAHDQYSDWYALGLAMYRGLLLTPGKLDSKTTDGKWPSPSKIPDSLGPRIANLLHRALDDPLSEERRPSPREWSDALIAEYLPEGRFNDRSVAILDKVSAPRQAFSPLPDRDWSSTHSKPKAPPPRPTQSRWPPSSPSPQTRRPAPPPPPSWTVPPPPPPQPWLSPVRAQVGWFARDTLNRGPRWYLLGLFTCLIAPFIAVIYIAVGGVQLRKGSSSDPEVKSARRMLLIYGAFAMIWWVLEWTDFFRRL